MDVVFIGTSFYRESKTYMSSIYERIGHMKFMRTDWGFIERHLANNGSVHIRPATEEELEYFKKKLEEIQSL